MLLCGEEDRCEEVAKVVVGVGVGKKARVRAKHARQMPNDEMR